MVDAAAAAGKRERKTVERLVQAPAPVIKKKEKNPNAPKRNMSAYMFYANENRDRIKEENAGCSFGEVGKHLGAAWSKADGKTKAKFEAMAAKDKERYEKEKAAYGKKKKK